VGAGFSPQLQKKKKKKEKKKEKRKKKKKGLANFVFKATVLKVYT